MTESHAEFSPSKLPRIIACPGSVQATKHLEQSSSSYAEEGTMLHSVVEESLNLSLFKVSEACKKEYKLTSEHVEAVEEVLDYVQALRYKHAEDGDIFEGVENRVSLAGFIHHTNCEELADVEGTLDYSLEVPSLKLLYIIDWKFGKGVEVFPDSEQLFAYALGYLKNVVNMKKYTKVILVIGQPRLYSGELFKEYETTVEYLFNWLTDTLVPALLQVKSKHPTFCPTEKGCMWCLVKNTCKHRKNLSMKLAADVFKIHAKLPDKTDEDEIAEFLAKLPDLKKYISDIEKYAYAVIQDGRSIPGFKLVAGRSIRKWKDEKKALAFFSGQDYETEDLLVSKFKSPTQIEALIGKKNVTKEVQELIHKPVGAPTLVPESDKRPALDFESIENKFKKYLK